MDTGEPMRFKWYFITVKNKTRENITEAENNFARLFNQNVRYKKTECKLQIQSNFKELMEKIIGKRKEYGTA